jgi:ABC-type Mn2+/Zn2+ transport system permease subunit
MMFDAVELYIWPICGGTLIGCVLTIVGVHLSARGRTLQTLCVSQGAELGALTSVLIGLLSGSSFESLTGGGEVFGALVGSLLCGVLARLVGRVRQSSRTTALFVLWLTLVAFMYLAISVHPLLESHFARVFLGDVSTMTDKDGQWTAGLGVAAFLWCLLSEKRLTRRTFDIAVFRQKLAAESSFDEFILLSITAVSTWSMGFLFSCACLFVPTVIHAAAGQQSSRSHHILCVCSALFAVPFGFVGSLMGTQLPTVPLITLTLVLISVGIAIVGRLSQGKDSVFYEN